MSDDDIRKIITATQAIFNTPDGEIVLEYLMDEFLYQRPSQDGQEALFQNGERNVVLTLAEFMKHET